MTKDQNYTRNNVTIFPENGTPKRNTSQAKKPSRLPVQNMSVGKEGNAAQCGQTKSNLTDNGNALDHGMKYYCYVRRDAELYKSMREERKVSKNVPQVELNVIERAQKGAPTHKVPPPSCWKLKIEIQIWPSLYHARDVERNNKKYTA